MNRKWFLALFLGAMLAGGTPNAGWAQGNGGTVGSGAVAGDTTDATTNDEHAKNVTVNSAPGSSGSQPETSLSGRNASDPTNREADVPRQVGILAPVAFFVFLVLAGGLYWFVFRKPTTPEGEAASKGQT